MATSQQQIPTDHALVPRLKKMGRPPIEIDWQIFEALCGVQGTEEEIASYFHCSVATLARGCVEEYGETFAEVYKRFAGTGKISLRRAQFRKAIEGDNPTMQIWLGKQHLGQRDQQDVHVGSDALDVMLNRMAEMFLSRVREGRMEPAQQFPPAPKHDTLNHHGNNGNGTQSP